MKFIRVLGALPHRFLLDIESFWGRMFFRKPRIDRNLLRGWRQLL